MMYRRPLIRLTGLFFKLKFMENQSNNFIQKLLLCITPNSRVLDLGAGGGKYAEKFARLGARVVAVDRKKPTMQHPLVEWRSMLIEDFLPTLTPTETFNLILLHNIIQFLNKKWVISTLIPQLKAHLRADGILAIRTFYQEPSPPFEKPCTSFYLQSELLPLFLKWENLHVDMYDTDVPDMRGRIRHFYLTELMVRKI